MKFYPCIHAGEPSVSPPTRGRELKWLAGRIRLPILGGRPPRGGVS